MNYDDAVTLIALCILIVYGYLRWTNPRYAYLRALERTKKVIIKVNKQIKKILKERINENTH